MQKILILVCFCLSFFLFFTVHAAPDSGRIKDVTSQSFMVDLGKVDPLSGTSGRSSPPPGIGAFMQLLGNITDILLFMIPIFAAVSLLIAGYFFIFSAGDSEKATKAKTIIKWNIVAILVAFLSYGIIKIVAGFFS